MRNLQNKLAFSLHQRLANPDDLLSEPPHIAEERKALAAQVEILVKASAVLSRDVELSVGIGLDTELERKYTELLNNGTTTTKQPPMMTKQPMSSSGGVFAGLSGGGAAPPSVAAQPVRSNPSPPPAPATNGHAHGGGLFGGGGAAPGGSLFAATNEVKQSGIFDRTKKNPLFD